MSNSTQDTESNADNHDSQQSESDNSINKRPVKYFVGLLCIIAFIIMILIAAGYMYIKIGRQQQQQFSYLNHHVKKLHQHQQTISQQPDQNSQAIKKLQTQVHHQQQTINKLQKQLQQHASRVQLKQIHYWVRSAILQLKNQHNQQSAIAYLKAARDTVQHIDDLQLDHLEQALTQRITQLEGVNQVPTQSLYHQLIALQAQTQQLSFIPSQFTRHIDGQHDNLLSKHQDKAPSKHWWQTLSHSVWHGLSQALIIQHNQQHIKPLLPQAAQGLVKLNTDQAYSQAQWGLLTQQSTVYHHNLKRIQQILKAYYHPSSQRHNILNHLEKLNQKQIQPQLPNIDKLLKQIPTSFDEAKS